MFNLGRIPSAVNTPGNGNGFCKAFLGGGLTDRATAVLPAQEFSLPPASSPGHLSQELAPHKHIKAEPSLGCL